MASDSSLKLFCRGEAQDSSAVFVGEPAFLKGDVWFQNDEPTDLLIREASLISPSIQGLNIRNRDRLARIPVPKVLSAHERKRVSISFSLDPSTPPGTYPAEIRIEETSGTKTFAAHITVVQNYALSLEPDQFVFTVPAGGTAPGELIVRNEGNVPIHVMPMGEYILKLPTSFECGCAARERRSVDRDRRKHLEASENPESEDEDEGFGSLVIQNEDMLVRPGTWALARFTVKLPESLPANGHFRARPRIGTERFNVDILTSFEGPLGGTKQAPAKKRK